MMGWHSLYVILTKHKENKFNQVLCMSIIDSSIIQIVYKHEFSLVIMYVLN